MSMQTVAIVKTLGQIEIFISAYYFQPISFKEKLAPYRSLGIGIGRACGNVGDLGVGVTFQSYVISKFMSYPCT